MRRFFALLAVGAAMLSASAQAGYSSSLDKNGCWDGLDDRGVKCIAGDAGFRGDVFILTLTNRCANRVYARYCNEVDNGPAQCGAWGIRGYSSNDFRTSQGATGRTRWVSVGSKTASGDRACAETRRNWYDLF